MPTDLLEIWYAALNSEFGVIVHTSDFEGARQRLYAARRESADASLANLGICQSPVEPTDLWIVRKGPK